MPQADCIGSKKNSIGLDYSLGYLKFLQNRLALVRLTTWTLSLKRREISSITKKFNLDITVESLPTACEKSG